MGQNVAHEHAEGARKSGAHMKKHTKWRAQAWADLAAPAWLSLKLHPARPMDILDIGFPTIDSGVDEVLRRAEA